MRKKMERVAIILLDPIKKKCKVAETSSTEIDEDEFQFHHPLTKEGGNMPRGDGKMER